MPRITADHLRALPGLRQGAREALLIAQPSTVREALRIPDVGRKTTRHLLALGLLTDPDDLQQHSLAEVERRSRHRQ